MLFLLEEGCSFGKNGYIMPLSRDGHKIFNGVWLSLV